MAWEGSSQTPTKDWCGTGALSLMCSHCPLPCHPAPPLLVLEAQSTAGIHSFEAENGHFTSFSKFASLGISPPQGLVWCDPTDADELIHTHVRTGDNCMVLVGRLAVEVPSLGLVKASSLGWYPAWWQPHCTHLNFLGGKMQLTMRWSPSHIIFTMVGCSISINRTWVIMQASKKTFLVVKQNSLKTWKTLKRSEHCLPIGKPNFVFKMTKDFVDSESIWYDATIVDTFPVHVSKLIRCHTQSEPSWTLWIMV